jgi:hypothetical protein
VNALRRAAVIWGKAARWNGKCWRGTTRASVELFATRVAVGAKLLREENDRKMQEILARLRDEAMERMP